MAAKIDFHPSALYEIRVFSLAYSADKTVDCTKMCDCLNSQLEIVHGADGRTFASPCHAGCTRITTNGARYVRGNDIGEVWQIKLRKLVAQEVNETSLSVFKRISPMFLRVRQMMCFPHISLRLCRTGVLGVCVRAVRGQACRERARARRL